MNNKVYPNKGLLLDVQHRPNRGPGFCTKEGALLTGGPTRTQEAKLKSASWMIQGLELTLREGWGSVTCWLGKGEKVLKFILHMREGNSCFYMGPCSFAWWRRVLVCALRVFLADDVKMSSTGWADPFVVGWGWCKRFHTAWACFIWP